MREQTGVIVGVRVTHEDATVDQLEAAAADSQRHAVESLLSRRFIEEAFVLQTCNRTESYVVAPDHETGLSALSPVVADVPEDVVLEMDHEESLRHLLRVGAGLESIVLGEDQILGQLRDAYEDARGVGGIGTLLEDGVTKAMRVGERARNETAINEGVVSLASAAVRLVNRECALAGETALVVGAGEMGQLAARALAERVDRVLVANRTVPHAEHVAETIDVDASAVALNAVEAAVESARIVVSATGSNDHVFDADTFAESGETYVVDIAQPRDVSADAAEVPGVSVYDLDALESVTEETRAQRKRAAEEVEEIVDEEFDRLLAQYKRKRADRVISAMYESAEQVKAAELNRAMASEEFDEAQRDVMESMADAIVSQLLAAPTRSLRDAAEDDDWSTIQTALELFDPDFGPDSNDPPAFVEDMAVEDIPEGMREEIPASVLDQLADD
ncbi:glutamyl-tRNA reductase [Halomicroarcula limicola]|uniref:Glutamyl-tRNA reductase n=1 Tax=Haloarcula limicola TaxID=1429915 RepID=A0A8J7YAH9_9EURY|nr:glutamyl-tRNA reductase [Halomicroarcula limicola]MBV0924699.1 glutamyl-tRNA reductase [Halomicroarcula limicola]